MYKAQPNKRKTFDFLFLACETTSMLYEPFEKISVFDPTLGPGHGFWPGHQLTRVNSNFFYKSKLHCFGKKKYKLVNRLQLGFWPVLAGSTHRVNQVFNYPYYFINPARFQPRVSRVFNYPYYFINPVGFQINQLGHVLKLWKKLNNLFLSLY